MADGVGSFAKRMPVDPVSTGICSIGGAGPEGPSRARGVPLGSCAGWEHGEVDQMAIVPELTPGNVTMKG